MEKNIVKLNGSKIQDNCIWAGAMNLAWNQLITSIIHQKIDLGHNIPAINQMIFNFNNSLFNKNSLSSNSYYVKAGYGQKTVQLINEQSKKKFPNKTFSDLTYKLADLDIISYAYLFKSVSFLYPFNKQDNFYFMNTKVKGFIAKTAQHRKNILVGGYVSDDEFIIKFNLKEKSDELFIIKGKQNLQAYEVVSLIQNTIDFEQVKSKQKFSMPIIDIDIQREYKELLNISLKNKNFTQYHIEAMIQRIKFRLDEQGAKVQNQGVIVMTRCMVLNSRCFVINRPFWVIMRQKKNHPYFVARIGNTKFMIK